MVGGFFNTRATWEATQKLIKLIYKGSLQGLYSERDLSNIYIGLLFIRGFPCGSAGKKSTCNVGDLGSIPGLGRFPGERKGYPLWYSGLENSMG